MVEGPEGDLVYDVFADQRTLDSQAEDEQPSSSMPPEEREAAQIAYESVTEDEGEEEEEDEEEVVVKENARGGRGRTMVVDSDEPMSDDNEIQVLD